MQTASNNSLLFNNRKFQIKWLNIMLNDTIYRKEGMKANPEKIWGITEMLLFRCATTAIPRHR